jgi:hypothetical protein
MYFCPTNSLLAVALPKCRDSTLQQNWSAESVTSALRGLLPCVLVTDLDVHIEIPLVTALVAMDASVVSGVPLNEPVIESDVSIGGLLDIVEHHDDLREPKF